MTVNLSKLAFYSGVNYMKRSTFVGSADLALPAHGGSVSTTITHSLGYIPFFQVFSEIDATSTIWTPSKLDKYTDSTLSSDTTDPTLSSWPTTTTLTIRIDNNTTPTATGTRTVYWIIYLDYGTS